MRLYLVRHGRTSWNIQGKLQGHADIPLDEVGTSQAISLGQAFESLPLDQILSSDLQRASMTAEYISKATGAGITQRPDLRERNFGDWEGLDVREAAARTLELSLSQGISTTFVRPPNGESHADVWERVATIFAELDATDQRIAIVAHGGSTAALLGRLLRGTVETMRTFRLGNTSVTELERRADGFHTMLRYSDTSHLSTVVNLPGSADGPKR